MSKISLKATVIQANKETTIISIDGVQYILPTNSINVEPDPSEGKVYRKYICDSGKFHSYKLTKEDISAINLAINKLVKDYTSRMKLYIDANDHSMISMFYSDIANFHKAASKLEQGKELHDMYNFVKTFDTGPREDFFNMLEDETGFTYV